MARRICTLWTFLGLLLIASGARAADHTVFIYDYYFTPTNLTVAPGDSVTWINKGFQPHDSTDLGGNWASPLLYNDEEFFLYTFNQAGRFPYICLSHIGDFPQQTGLVVVASANLPPSVRITSPANGAMFTAPASFTINADASDSDGSVTNVQFFLNGSPVGTSPGPTFGASVSGLASNTYTITAVAADNLGATTTSDAITVVVQEDNPTKYPLTVSVLPPGSGSVAVNPPQPVDGYNAGTVVTLTANAATGFAFNGWSGAATGMQNPLSVTMDSAKSITANFSSNTVATHTLTLLTNPPGAGLIQVSPAPNAAGGAYVDGTVVTLTAVSAVDFAFTNWTGDVNSTSNSITFAIDADKTITANFFESITPKFTLTLITNPPGAGTIQASPPPGTNGTYVQGTLVTLTASAVGTNLFTNWSGAVSSASNPVTVLMDADKTATATFVPIIPVRYTLTVVVTPTNAGVVAVTPPSSDGSYSAGAVLAIAAQPNAGFRFVRWSGADNSTNNPIVLTMNGNKSLTAIFEAIPALDLIALAGVYAGLLIDEGDTNYTSSGFLSVRVSKTGRYRGTATIGGMRQFIAGQFDRFGYAPLVVRRATLSGSLQIDSVGIRMIGSLTDDKNPNPRSRRTPALLLYRATTMTNAAASAGNYTVTFEAHEPVPNPGSAAMQILPNGVVRLRGTLGDGTALNERTFLSPDATIPLFVQLYHNRGVILGWLALADDGSVQGTARWFRPADSRSLNYPDGFALKISVTGSRAE